MSKNTKTIRVVVSPPTGPASMKTRPPGWTRGKHYFYVDEDGFSKSLPRHESLMGVVGTAVASRSDAAGNEIGLTEAEALEIVRILNLDAPTSSGAVVDREGRRL